MPCRRAVVPPRFQARGRAQAQRGVGHAGIIAAARQPGVAAFIETLRVQVGVYAMPAKGSKVAVPYCSA